MEAKLKFGIQRPLVLLASAAIIAGCATEPAPVEDRSLVEPVPVTTKAGEGPYRVVRGDTLYAIAFKRGLDYRDVAAWNGIAPPYKILVGQELRFTPPSAGPRTAAVAGVPPASSAIPGSAAAPTSKSPSAATTGATVAATSKSGGLFEDVPSQFSPPAHAAPDAASATTSTQGRPTAAAAAPAERAAADTDDTPEPKPAAAAASAAPAPAASAVPGSASTSTSQTSTAPPVAVPSKPVLPPETAPAPAKPSNDAAVANAGGIGWRWPSTGKLLGGFVGGDQTKQGIDIGGNEGDPVRAAADGEVVYSGNGLIGYGELIIIKHNASFLSAYGHNRKRLVQEGDKVRRASRSRRWARARARATNCISRSARTANRSIRWTICLPAEHTQRRKWRYAATMNAPERADDIASDELLELIDAIEPQQDDEARDSTSAYLAEIGLIPLLDFDEEQRLAERVACRRRRGAPSMIEANLRLVVASRAITSAAASRCSI